MERRDFLGAAAAALGIGAVGPGVSGRGALRALSPAAADSARPSGNDSAPHLPGTGLPEVWGVQLYTLRSLMAQDVSATLRTVADLGYGEVEFAGFFDWEPRALGRLLQVLGLKPTSAHMGLDVVRGDWEAALEGAVALGARYVVVPWIPQDLRTVDGYSALADELNAAGEVARQAGVRVGYHNHDFEFATLEGSEYDHGLHLLLERTDPELVTFQLDLYWAAHAGIDSRQLFREHTGRFTSVHAKDRARDGEMVAVGEGALDFRMLFAAGERAGVEHAFVEHDNPQDPLASVTSSIEYLKSLRGG